MPLSLFGENDEAMQYQLKLSWLSGTSTLHVTFFNSVTSLCNEASLGVLISVMLVVNKTEKSILCSLGSTLLDYV
jgi:hypothetical protein